MAGQTSDDGTFDDFVDGYVKKQRNQQTVSDRIAAGRPRQAAGAPAAMDVDAPSLQSTRPPAVKDSDFEGSTLQFGPIDTGVKLPNAVAKGLAQVGSGIADYPLRIRQIMGKATREDADEKRRIDDPLNRGFAGTINNFAGKVLPALAIPATIGSGAVAPLITGFGAGALQGALEPVATGESATKNMLMGAAFGSLIPGAKLGLQSMTNQFDPFLGPLARSAEQRGFNFGTADTADQTSLMRSVRNVGRYFPGSAQYINRVKDQNEDQFMREIARTIELPAGTDRITKGTLRAQKGNIGQRIGDIWDNNELIVTPQLRTSLRNARVQAIREQTPETAAVVERQINNFNSKVRFRTNPQTGQLERYIPGNEAHALQSEWNKRFGRFSANPDDASTYIQDIRRSMNNTFHQGLPADEGARLLDANNKYRAIKSLEDPVAAAEVGKAQGQPGRITPQALSIAVDRGFKGDVTTPFGDLPQIGQQFLRDTSTRNRDILANWGVPMAFGATSGLLASPTFSGGVGGAGLGAATLGALVPTILSSPGMRRQIANAPSTYGGRAIGNIMRKGAAAGPLAFSENMEADAVLGPVEEEELSGQIPR